MITYDLEQIADDLQRWGIETCENIYVTPEGNEYRSNEYVIDDCIVEVIRKNGHLNEVRIKQ